MFKRMKQLIVMVLVLVMSISVLAVPAAAEGSYQASIPVEIRIDPHYIPAQKDLFKIRVTPGSGSPLPAGGSNGLYTLVGAGTMDLDFTLPGLGVYTYEIRQEGCYKNNEVNGDCYLDPAIYDLIIYVINEKPENPSQGGIVVQVTLKLRGDKNDPKPDKALFVNKYAKPASVDLGATKIYNNRTPKTGLFDFVLKDSRGKVLETVSNVGKDVSFDTRVYDQEGTYSYTISEINDHRSGVIYDKSVYTVTVVVDRDVENHGDYVAKVTYKKNSKTVDAEDVTFVNKSDTGGLPFTGDQFRLVLWCSIMVGSLAAVVVLLVLRKKRKK